MKRGKKTRESREEKRHEIAERKHDRLEKNMRKQREKTKRSLAQKQSERHLSLSELTCCLQFEDDIPSSVRLAATFFYPYNRRLA